MINRQKVERPIPIIISVVFPPPRPSSLREEPEKLPLFTLLKIFLESLK